MTEQRVFRSPFPDMTDVPFGSIADLQGPEVSRAVDAVTSAVSKPYGPLRGDSQNEEMAAEKQRSGSES